MERSSLCAAHRAIADCGGDEIEIVPRHRLPDWQSQKATAHVLCQVQLLRGAPSGAFVSTDETRDEGQSFYFTDSRLA
jgi:hypothetical protein